MICSNLPSFSAQIVTVYIIAFKSFCEGKKNSCNLYNDLHSKCIFYDAQFKWNLMELKLEPSNTKPLIVSFSINKLWPVIFNHL